MVRRGSVQMACPSDPRQRICYTSQKNYRGNVTVYRMQEGMDMPDGLIVLHERDDHYSLQTEEPVELDELNQRLTSFLEELPSQTRDQFVDQLEDPDDQDN
mmetsp:Transcript_5306/g.11732  ORF Transcript_5306/g.11732 Transcript_5306/m.11732 type:complete len:101 (+) Transcript_5306:179-481(+)